VKCHEQKAVNMLYLALYCSFYVYLSDVSELS